jgi:hypothetical protein
MPTGNRRARAQTATGDARIDTRVAGSAQSLRDSGGPISAGRSGAHRTVSGNPGNATPPAPARDIESDFQFQYLLTPPDCSGIFAAVKMKSDSIFISMAQ